MSRTVLAPPSAEARAQLACDSFDPDAGKSRRRELGECLRRDAKGAPIEARYRLVSRDSSYARRANPVDDGTGNWGQGREPGYAAFGNARFPGWSRDWPGGWRRDDQPAAQGQQRGFFWNW
jgi:hypothetical protein